MLLFGDFVREKRQKKGLTLAKFSEIIKTDIGQWSKIERNLELPPSKKEKFEKLAEVLELNERQLFRLKSLAYHSAIQISLGKKYSDLFS